MVQSKAGNDNDGIMRSMHSPNSSCLQHPDTRKLYIRNLWLRRQKQATRCAMAISQAKQGQWVNERELRCWQKTDTAEVKVPLEGAVGHGSISNSLPVTSPL